MCRYYFFRTLKFTCFFLLASLTLACTGASHVKPLSDTVTGIDPNQEEINILNQQSADFHKEIKRRGLLYRDKEVNQYINEIGMKLAPSYMKINDGLHFYIIKDASANAMALPNGNIYINIGLLSVVESEDQLASILAHEIGHVTYRHSLKSMLNRQETKLAANIADIFLLGTGLGYIPAAGNLASFSRDQELEADNVSLTYMNKAGYDLQQSPEVFNIFQSLPESLTVKYSAYSSHPENEERSRNLEKVISESYAGVKRVPVVSEVFNNARRKIVENNVNIRLTNHQYELALLTLEQAEVYYKKAPLIQYYRGEVYRLKADNPQKAADEIKLLTSNYEEEKEVRKDLDYFLENKATHYDQAETLYDEALSMRPDLALAHKGLGLLYYSNENYKKAVMHLNTYLEMSDSVSDGLYIKRLIRNINNKEIHHD